MKNWWWVLTILAGLGVGIVGGKNLQGVSPIQVNHGGLISPIGAAPIKVYRQAVPRRLIIPKIGVNAEVEAVGEDETGRMAVPSTPEKVGWYHYGKRPGEPGQAVIDGHLDTEISGAVFAELKRLTAGDKIVVEDEEGQSQTFVVTRSVSYKDEELPIEEIFGKTSQQRLNLITCSGSFLTTQQKYSDRLVVFSELETN